jgi:hypothetical protein
MIEHMGGPRSKGTENAAPSDAQKALLQLMADVRSQPRPPAEWQPFPDSEHFLRECDPVARKLVDARRSVTRIVLDDRGDRL